MSVIALAKLNATWKDDFLVTDPDGNVVTGIAAGAFTATLTNAGVSSAQAVTIAEATAVDGTYEASFTPNATGGPWRLTITHATYGRWVAELRVVNRDQDDLAFPLTSGRGLGVDTSGNAQTKLDNFVTRSGTCQAGSTSANIVLDSGASATDNSYLYSMVFLTGGTGAGQTRAITSYTGSTKTATVSPTWSTTPDNTSTFIVAPILTAMGLDWRNVVNPTTTLDLSNTTIKNLDNAPPGGITTTQVENAVWDAARSSHVAAGSFGERVLANLTQWAGSAPNALISGRVDADLGLLRLRVATAQAGSVSTTIVLDAGASATDNAYTAAFVVLTGGTGSGQARAIVGYTGSTKTATVSPSWATNPDATTTFAIYLLPGMVGADVKGWQGDFNVTGTTGSHNVKTDVEEWRASAPNALISGRVDANAQVVGDKTGYTVSTNNDKTGYALSSAGVQAIWDALTSALTTSGSIGKRLADDIDATVSSRLPTSSYTAPPSVASIVNGVWDELQAGHATAGTFGKLMAFLDAAVTSRATPAQILATPANLLATDGTGRVTVGTNADKTGYSLSAAEEAAIASAVWALAGAIDGTITPAQAVMYIFAAVAGASSGEPNGANDTFKGPSGSVRVTTTYDANNNRTGVTLS